MCLLFNPKAATIFRREGINDTECTLWGSFILKKQNTSILRENTRDFRFIGGDSELFKLSKLEGLLKGNEDEVIFILNSLETLSNALGNNFSLDASANVVLTTWVINRILTHATPQLLQ